MRSRLPRGGPARAAPSRYIARASENRIDQANSAGQIEPRRDLQEPALIAGNMPSQTLILNRSDRLKIGSDEHKRLSCRMRHLDSRLQRPQIMPRRAGIARRIVH